MGERDPFDNGTSELLVAAVHGVFVCSADACVELFSSGSKGIVAARRTRNDGDILAVADSHIVLLHHIGPGKQRTYRLNSTGLPRQLWYDNRNDCLIYTTALESAVQVYSLKSQKFLAPATSHPSPPTLFTVHTSKNMDILLSASARPPTIFITSMEGGGDRAKCLVQPPCTDSACSAAAFHPSPGPGPDSLLFVLGFVDGTIAAYSYHTSCLQSPPDYHWEELASLRRAHVCVTESSPSRLSRLRAAAAAASAAGSHLSPDWSSGTSEPVKVGDIATAVTAIALIPGYLCLSASIGSDGRCCITDFEPEAGPKVLRSWNTHGSATALAVNKDKVAIGLKIGRLLVYDLFGDTIFCREFGGHKIVDLEWVGRQPRNDEPGETLQPTTNQSALGCSNGDFLKSTPRSVEKSPSFISLPAQYSSNRHRQPRKSVGSTSSDRLAKTTNSVSKPKQIKTFTPTSTTDTPRAGPRTASRIPAKAVSKPFALRSSVRPQLDDKRASSASSTGTTRRVSVDNHKERESSHQNGGNEPSQSVPPPKTSHLLSTVQTPTVPPRPTRSPTKQPAAVQATNSLPLANQLASVQAASRSTKGNVPPPSPLALDGSKDRLKKKATFVEPPRRHHLPAQRRHSSSSSIYSDDYVLEWGHASPAEAEAVSNKQPGHVLRDARFDPFRQPPELRDFADRVKTIKRATNPRQPVLKAPFPGQRPGTMISDRGSPATPKANFNSVNTPTTADSATMHHSDAKKVRRSASSNTKGAWSPTPTRRRKDHSVELDLLSTPRRRSEKAKQGIVEASSKATSSYVTAQTQTQEPPWTASSAPSWRVVDADAVIRESCLELRAEMNTLLERHEKALHQVFSKRLV